jgi:hypothetical protein
MAARKKDLTGRQFGWLTVLREAGGRGSHGDVLWLVRCRCGKEYEKGAASLLKPPRSTTAVTSCGCAPHNREYVSKYEGAGELSGHRFGYLTNQARQRGIAFTVNAKYLWDMFLWQNRLCALTSVPLSLSKKRLVAGESVASLDRISSDFGYEPGNVQWVHPTINFMKHAMPQGTFIAWCQLVARRMGQ